MKPIFLIHDIAAVQKPISDVLSQNGESGGVPESPHGVFWSTLTCNAFMTVRVPCADLPVPIVVIRNSAQSKPSSASERSAVFHGGRATALTRNEGARRLVTRCSEALRC
jgi:hypothetical protein